MTCPLSLLETYWFHFSLVSFRHVGLIFPLSILQICWFDIPLVLVTDVLVWRVPCLHYRRFGLTCPLSLIQTFWFDVSLVPNTDVLVWRVPCLQYRRFGLTCPLSLIQTFWFDVSLVSNTDVLVWRIPFPCQRQDTMQTLKSAGSHFQKSVVSFLSFFNFFFISVQAAFNYFLKSILSCTVRHYGVDISTHHFLTLVKTHVIKILYLKNKNRKIKKKPWKFEIWFVRFSELLILYYFFLMPKMRLIFAWVYVLLLNLQVRTNILI